MQIDGDCNFLLTVFIANKISCQMTRPSMNSKLSSAFNKFFASVLSLNSVSLD
jgi:hypothetical protein